MKRAFAITVLGLILAGGLASCNGERHLCESYGNKSSSVDQNNQELESLQIEEIPS
jgi:hypothetical protein